MGGYGTLIYALKYPQLFAAAAPLSAAVIDDDGFQKMPEANYESTFGQLFGRGLKGADRNNQAWKDNSIINLVNTKSPNDIRKVKFWIDCGDDDFLTKGNCLLHIAMLEKQIPHEFRVRDGAHTWTYWRTGITDALQFMGDSFRQK
jgi:S-formylglutathione hydrolase FrmB